MSRRNKGLSSVGILVSIAFHVILVIALIILSLRNKSEISLEQKSIEVSLATGKIGGSTGNKGQLKSNADDKNAEANKKEEIKEIKKEEKKAEEKEPEEDPKMWKDKVVIQKKEEKKEEPKKVEKKKKVAKKEKKEVKKEEKKKEVASKEEVEKSSRDDVLKELKKKAILKELKNDENGGNTEVAEAGEGEGSDGLEKTGTGGGESVNPVVLDIYYKTISAKIEDNLKFPGSIEASGHLESEISFKLYESGGAYNISVYKSSKNNVVDMSCISAVKSASPFPAPPKELRKIIKEEPFIFPCSPLL